MTISPEDAPHVERLLKAIPAQHIAYGVWQATPHSPLREDRKNAWADACNELDNAIDAYAAHKGKKVQDA